MKKFFSFFAFVATLVLGVITFTSCSSDSDSYTIEGYLTTTNSQLQNSDRFKEANQGLSSKLTELNQLFKEASNDSEAEKIWKLIEDQSIGWQDVVNTFAQKDFVEYNNPGLSMTFDLKKNGKVWKTRTWTAR